MVVLVVISSVKKAYKKTPKALGRFESAMYVFDGNLYDFFKAEKQQLRKFTDNEH